MSEPAPSNDAERGPVGFLPAIGSVLAAAFGVSSARKRERDFKHGRASTFIVAGIVFTLLFVACVTAAVKLALHAAGQ